MKTIYELFIEYCRDIENREISSGKYLESHHIIPRHKGGSDNKENLIKLSRTNHILAHQYLWIAHNSEKDRIAYLWMRGDITGEAKRLSGKLGQKNRSFDQRSTSSKKAAETQKLNNSGIFNRNYSWKENVSKAAKNNITENRKKRFSNETINLSKQCYELSYKETSFCINQSNFSDFVETSKYIFDILKIQIKVSEHKKFIRLFNGSRTIFHGLKLNKVISSQAVGGLDSTEGSETREMSPNNNSLHECPPLSIQVKI